MRDLIFQELRECNRTISQIDGMEERKRSTEILTDVVRTMYDLAMVARKEGLLALEEAAYGFENLYNGKYLKAMILLIVDGTSPDLVEEISTARYFAANLSGYEALHYLTMMFGSLAIQAGENPRVIEEKLLALLPTEVEAAYRDKQEVQDSINIRTESNDNEAHLEKYYKGGIAVTPDNEYYFQIKVLDYAITSLDDRSVQRLLRDVDNCDLTLAMKGLSGEARRRFLNNLSRRLAVMIAEDLENLGAVPVRDVATAVIKIFNVLIKLISYGEIVCADEEALSLFAKIFEVNEDEAQAKIIEEAESDLYELLREYNSAAHVLINAPWENV